MARNSKKAKREKWISTSQFGLLVGRTGKTIRNWIRDGYIPAECVRLERGQYRIRPIAQHCLGIDEESGQ